MTMSSEGPLFSLASGLQSLSPPLAVALGPNVLLSFSCCFLILCLIVVEQGLPTLSDHVSPPVFRQMSMYPHNVI